MSDFFGHAEAQSSTSSTLRWPVRSREKHAKRRINGLSNRLLPTNRKKTWLSCQASPNLLVVRTGSRNYLISTSAPASSSCFFRPSASFFGNTFFQSLGSTVNQFFGFFQAQTGQVLSPASQQPVSGPPAAFRITSNEVFSSGASAAAAPPPAIITGAAAAGSMPVLILQDSSQFVYFFYRPG